MRGALAAAALAALGGGGAAAADARAAVDACLAAGGDATACIGVTQDACQAADPTTLGIVGCLTAEAEAWDGVLNAVWPEVRKAMQALDAARPPELPKAWDATLAAQRAWLAFRDAECGALYAQYADGTIRSVVAGDCMMRLTAERALALRARLEP